MHVKAVEMYPYRDTASSRALRLMVEASISEGDGMIGRIDGNAGKEEG